MVHRIARALLPALLALALPGLAAPQTATQPATAPAPAGSVRHRFLAVDNGRNRLLHVDQSKPSASWAVDIPAGSRDLQVLETGRVLVSHGNGAGEYDLATGKRLWQVEGYAGIQSAYRLGDGRTCLAANSPAGVVIHELDRDGKPASKRTLPGLKDCRLVRPLEAGRVLLTSARPNRAVEVDADGKVVWQAALDGKGYKALRLGDGRTLVSTSACTILEFDVSGKVVARRGGKDGLKGILLDTFSGFDLLRGGTVVVANWLGHGKGGVGPHLLELAPDGRVVWQWDDHQAARQVTNVLVLE